ncbi:hypothetical protein THAOC_33281, partial [Thalassiosira oceanica]
QTATRGILSLLMTLWRFVPASDRASVSVPYTPAFLSLLDPPSEMAISLAYPDGTSPALGTLDVSISSNSRTSSEVYSLTGLRTGRRSMSDLLPSHFRRTSPRYPHRPSARKPPRPSCVCRLGPQKNAPDFRRGSREYSSDGIPSDHGAPFPLTSIGTTATNHLTG